MRGRRRRLNGANSSLRRQDIPYQLRIAERPPQPILLPARGEKESRAVPGEQATSALVLATHSRPRFARPKPRTLLRLKEKEGRRSAEKARLSRGASPRQQMLLPACASGEAARSAERARLSALHRGSGFGAEARQHCPGRASRDAVRRRYLHLGIALKRGTSRAGRNAGGVDAGPPESGSDELPPAGTAPTPSVGVTG